MSRIRKEYGTLNKTEITEQFNAIIAKSKDTSFIKHITAYFQFVVIMNIFDLIGRDEAYYHTSLSLLEKKEGNLRCATSGR